RGPTRVAGEAAFVPDPADVRSDVAEDAGVRLHRADHFPRLRPIVVGVSVDRSLLFGAAVKAIAAVGAIVPDLENRTVLSKQFAELRAVDLDVLGAAVGRIVAIPGRKVDTELELLTRGRLREFLDNVAPSAAPFAVDHGMFGSLRGPKAEAIVMLGG